MTAKSIDSTISPVKRKPNTGGKVRRWNRKEVFEIPKKKNTYRVMLGLEPVEVEVKATNPDEAEYEAYQLIQNLRKVDITVREMIDIAEVS